MTVDYTITVKTNEGTVSFMRQMPSVPKTQKGIKSHNTRLEKYAMKMYPNWEEIEIKMLCDSQISCTVPIDLHPIWSIICSSGGDHTPTDTNTQLHSFFIMRKIESQMIDAINANKNWKSANTEVRTDDNNESRVFLHGNHIATVTDDDMMIMDGGWQSNTTKSRLNALCDAFCIAGECVFQKDFVWYVRHFTGKINGQDVFKTNKFYNGYTFA